jgi:putative transcriptional regulator
LLASGDRHISSRMADRAQPQHLTGMLLVAMPTMADPRFARSVIYLCAHSPEGAMGLVVNQAAESVTFPAVIDQLGITPTTDCADTPVHVGGPVEASRGFVLHSPDYVLQSTLVIDENFALTATVDVLRAIADGKGPKRRVLALGYAGWGAGQLDAEIQANGWLLAPADADIVFGRRNEAKWDMALSKIGVDPRLLSTTAGHA